MPSLLTWIMSVIGPIAKRLLASLGIGWVVLSSYKAALDQVRAEVLTLWGSVPADVVNYMILAGFGEALGVILGAMAFRASMAAIGYLGKINP